MQYRTVGERYPDFEKARAGATTAFAFYWRTIFEARPRAEINRAKRDYDAAHAVWVGEFNKVYRPK